MKQLVTSGSVREVRTRLFIDGDPFPGLISLDVTQNSHYQADKYRCEVALNDPDGKDLVWWGADERKGMLLDLRVSVDGAERSLILGEADELSIRPATGAIEISGRDLTARLIDNKIQQAFKNKTSSEIAIELAARRGLTPIVDATATPVSRYYSNDHDQVSNDQFSRGSTEWDLLTYLAQQEGFDVFVVGTDLHFEKAVDPATAEPYSVKWDQTGRSGDVIDMHLERSLTLAKDVVVLVRSWHSGKGHAFTKSSPPGASKGAVNQGKAQRYVVTRPNLTEDQAQQLANNMREDITKHERRIEFHVPGEVTLSPRDIISLTGCGGWDQNYFVNTVDRRVSMDQGFTMTVTAKNKNVESQAALA